MESNRYSQWSYATTAGAPVSVEVADTPGKRTLIGYAVVWGAISPVMRDGKRHQFVRGAIKWADQVFALWHHDPTTPLAGTKNTTLRMTEDDYGVRVEIDLDDTTDGDDAYKRVTSKLVTGMSFGGNFREFKVTGDPAVIQPVNFSAHEVTLTYDPAMRETEITTAEEFSTVEKERARRLAKNKLNTVRLALLRPF